MVTRETASTEFDNALALTIENIDTYKEIFMDSLKQKFPLSICISEVDTAGLQLLISLQKSVKEKNGKIEIKLEKPDLMELISPSGIHHQLF